MKNNMQLTALYAVVARDNRISVQHLCLYMGLCYWWAQNKCQNPVAITRKIVMDVSKIKSIVTYHKCMKELNDYGYIKYIPSFHPELGSTVFVQEQQEQSKDEEI